MSGAAVCALPSVLTVAALLCVRACACLCSVSKLPGKDEKDHEIMMQASMHCQMLFSALVCSSKWIGREAASCTARANNRWHTLPLPPSVQGDLLKQVAAFLTEQYGVPPALLELKSKAK